MAMNTVLNYEEEIILLTEWRDENNANNSNSSKETSQSIVLANAWVTSFHDVDTDGDIAIPELVANNQVYLNKTASTHWFLIMHQLSAETK